MPKTTLNLRLEPELKAALAELAERERRSITDLLERWIEERAKVAGVLPSDWRPPRRRVVG